MGSSLPTSNPQLRAKRGFALLITITLLAVIVLLLIGLAAYTRVETAVAGNTQRQAQARENALLALDVALGQLQKAAGPDRRVTATAENFGGASGTSHYTGVWDSTGTGTTPLTWLVSGNEALDSDGNPTPLAITPESTVNTTNAVSLVSTNTSRTANDVLARLMPVRATGIPGAPANTIIGRYAWWVGDQGVKAPVAIPDNSSSINFSPFDAADLRGRLRQQIAIGGAATNTAGAPVFEPKDTNNTSLVASYKVTAFNQVGFLKSSAGTPIGLTSVQQNFHAWTNDNSAVLTNTKLGGLRQDLSLNPSLLGSAYAAWANYVSYMEEPKPADPDAASPASTPVISPDYGSNPVRRRYLLQAPVTDGALTHSVAPVLSYFLLSFNVRTEPPSSSSNTGSSALSPVQARARWGISLWNPYTSALVPENLRIEVSGLPTAVQIVNDTRSTTPAVFSLQGTFEEPLKINLPWDSTTNSAADRQSWLPGRVYSWVAVENKAGTTLPEGFDSRFYSHNISGVSGQGVHRRIASDQIIGSDECHLVTDAVALTVKLYAVRTGGDVLLKTFTSPQFLAAQTTPAPLSAGSYTLTYFFRLGEGAETNWLRAPEFDLRSSALPAAAFVAGADGPDPTQYTNFVTFTAADRLLDRETTSLSYNEDTPLFELPRAPILSLGVLQHLIIDGRPAFAVGNSWSAGVALNGIPALELFDRYFYSGLSAEVNAAPIGGVVLLPNQQLRTVTRNATTGAAVTLDDLRNVPDAFSSKHLLQHGAFNVNSTRVTAWAAMLRGVRWPSNQTAGQFSFLDPSFGSGTTSDTDLDRVPSSATRATERKLPTDPEVGEATFFRFSQSAQETYKAFPGFAASTVDPEQSVGVQPDPISQARTDLFRKGMRKLTAAQTIALATGLVDAIKARQASEGPFRSLEEFLAGGAAGSVIEQAISTAGINIEADGTPIEFSSQFLTQGDVMTALAPFLFPRSDTFVIRTYGEVVNPATGAVEGRAWCEATVQRLPEYFDKTQAEETPPDQLNELNLLHGRRFKVVAFRWLTRSDI